MKRCPVCQSTYADDSLRFCLQDGAALEGTSVPETDEFKTLLLPDSGAPERQLPATEILPQSEAATLQRRPPQPTTPQPPRLTTPFAGEAATTPAHAASAAPTGRSTATIVAVSVVATLLLLGLGGLGAWLLLGGKKALGNDNAVNQTNPRAVNNQNSAQPLANANTNARANSNSATPTPTSQTSDMVAAEREIRDVLDAWTQATREKNLEDLMSYYSDPVETFYAQHNVAASRVSASKQEAFDKFETLELELSNVRVDVDPSGEHALATFDKTFDFKGEKEFSGSVQSQFTLVKTDDGWLIAGERDLQTYYLNK